MAWAILFAMLMEAPLTVTATENREFVVRAETPQEITTQEEAEEYFSNLEAERVQPGNLELAVAHTGVVHEINDWNTLMGFLDGSWPAAGVAATNADTFILTRDLSPPPGWVSLPNTQAVRRTATPWENARIGRPGTFTGVFDGQGYTITGLVLRPRRNVDHETGTRTLETTPYLNDYGFIRLMGHGAILKDIIFYDALFYDGGSSRTPTAADNTTSTVIENDLAGGNGPINTASGATGGRDRMATNFPTHRGIVAGRVAPGATVTIDGVYLGNPITGDGTTRASGYAANNISTSRHRGVWNFRMGGMIGATGAGSIVNISNSDVSARLFHQTLGAGGRQGGLVGESQGTLNVTNVNVHVTMYESNWGLEHGLNTIYAGGIVGNNQGALNINVGDVDGRNRVHAQTIRAGNITDRGGRYNSDGNGGGGTAAGGRNWGFFRNAGRIVGHSSGPINANHMNLTGHVFGLDDIGGAIGASTSSVILTNMNVSGQVGGPHETMGANTNPHRGVNAGGLIGRSAGPVIIDSVHVGLNPAGTAVEGDIFGGRRGTSNSAADTQGVGGLIGSANSVMITASSFQGTGTLNMRGNVGGLVGRATGVISITDSLTGSDVRMINGDANARHRPNGIGGIVGRVTAQGSVFMTDVTNNMPVQSYRGDVGGIVGRMQGRTLNLTGVENRGTVRQVQAAWANSAAALINDWRSAGGLVGQANNTDITITNSGNHAAIEGYARRRGTGGIIGRSTGAVRFVNLNNVENTAQVHRQARGRGHVGGFVGMVDGTLSIHDSINTGNVLTSPGTRTTFVASTERVNTMGGFVGQANRGLTIVNSGNEGHVVNTMNRTVRGLGGLAGYARGRTQIIDATNSGDLVSGTATANRQPRAEANIGGIIGRSDMRGASAALRQTVLTNVENTGSVGMDINPITGATLTTHTIVNSSGGIIGRSIHRPRNSYTITNAVNRGDVRARNYAGGIIGFNNSLNVTINQSANHGDVATEWGTTARGNAGGFIGRTARNSLVIHQGHNTGEVRSNNAGGNLGGTSAAALRRGSQGGLVGQITSGHVFISESFNAGVIRGVERNTGGLVGISRGTGRLVITDGFNIGDVTSQLTGSGTTAAHTNRRARAGNGILGFRDRGPVVIERVYNAAFVQGRPIYGSPVTAPGAAMGSYISFANAYYDSTIHSGVEQSVGRGTIGGANTDIMTRGILPGFTGALWRNGTIDEDGERLRNTYPYLAWQTEGELETPFFDRIREIPDELRAVMDLEGSGRRDTRFVLNPEHVGNVRYFMPYTQGGDTPAPGRVVPQHFNTIESETSDRYFTRDDLLSVGVVSENWVVGFDIRDRTGVAVIGVDALDYAIDPETAEHISWATFMVDGQPVTTQAGILIVRWTRNLVYPYNLEDAEPRYVEASAFGYADASRWVDPEADYLDNPDGLVRIPMEREDIPYVEVRIVTEVTVNDENTRVDRVANSHLAHERISQFNNSVTANQPGAVSTRHFLLDSVQFRDVLHAGAPNFSLEHHVVRFGSMELQNPSLPPGPNNRHIITIYLDDLRVGDLELRVRWYDPQDTDVDTDTDGSTPIRHNSQTGSAGVSQHTIAFRHPEGIVADPFPTHARVGTNADGRHNMHNLLYVTEVQVGAPGFRTSEWEAIEDMLEYGEGDNDGRLGHVFKYLDRLITINFNFVEYVFAGIDDDGAPIYNRVNVPASDVSIMRANEEADAEVEFFATAPHRVRGIDGESVRITAPGFVDHVHEISWMDDIVERMGAAATEATPPITASTVTATGIAMPVPDNGTGGTNATAHITIVLERPPVYHVILDSATPQYGAVTPGFVSVGVGETMNQANAPDITTTPQDAFALWYSPYGANAGQAWTTTAAIRDLPITVPFTRFSAYFEVTPQNLNVESVPGDANPEGKTATIGADPAVPAGNHTVMAGTNVELYAGSADQFTFLGWWRGDEAPAVGTNVSELDDVRTDPTRIFNKPPVTTNYFALWGNDEGYIGVPNVSPFFVTFHLYTDRVGIENEFGDEAELGSYEVLAIEVPVNPGEDREDWEDQDLLEIVLEIGNIYGTSGAPGHAFWGWFTGETLDDSGRARADSRRPGEYLRRPALGDECELETLLTLIEGADTDALLEALFGNADGGNINLFGIWSLWGDVNDDDVVDLYDVTLLRNYVAFDMWMPGVFILNKAAGNVVVDDEVDLYDVTLLRNYVAFDMWMPGVFILGLAPQTTP